MPSGALVDLTLRNFLCAVALREGHGKPFHVGTLVIALFDSFYLFDLGFGQTDVTLFSEVDLCLGRIVLSASDTNRWEFTTETNRAVWRLLALFDSQLSAAPVVTILLAHRSSEANFNAQPEHRLSIPALIER
jgi:hypothetical protein